MTQLSPDLSKEIQQNLANGQVPTPKQVASGQVPAAANACERFRKHIPSDWFQDLLEVPEDPGNPTGRKIHVFYYGKINPGTVPAIFFNGGPGGSSHGSFELFTSTSDYASPVPSFLHLDKRTSLVFVDQRGTGCSDFYPQGDSDEVLARLRFYGTRGIVSDAEQIRAKIWAGRKWIAFGQSYGAFVDHRYAMQAPEGLKAVFAHANALSPDPYERARDRIASQARVMETYYSQFPDDRALLAQLRTYMTPAKCFESEDKKEEACGYDVLSNFNELLGFTDSWLSIHQWVGTMVTPTGVSDSAIALFLSINYFSAPNPQGSQSTAMRVINWVDRGVVPFDFEHCRQIQADLQAKGIDLATVAINECSDAIEGGPGAAHPIVARVHALPQDLMTLEGFTAALTAHPELPFYLYSGANDPYLPVEVFAPELKAVAGLSNVHYTHFTGSGHNGFYTEPQLLLQLIAESAAQR